MTVSDVANQFNPKHIKDYQSLVLNPLTFRAGLVMNLPLASVTGVKLVRLDEEVCEVTVPYKFLNKNPFNTTYWAVLGMAAEMASGALLLMYTNKLQPSVSTFVINCEARFIKRAVGLTTFKCDQGLEIAEKVLKTTQTFEAEEVKCYTNAYNEQGEVVAEFSFTWGIKARKTKK